MIQRKHHQENSSNKCAMRVVTDISMLQLHRLTLLKSSPLRKWGNLSRGTRSFRPTGSNPTTPSISRQSPVSLNSVIIIPFYLLVIIECQNFTSWLCHKLTLHLLVPGKKLVPLLLHWTICCETPTWECERKSDGHF